MIWYYIQNCHIYRYGKVSKDWYNNLLKSLSILFCSWIEVIIDFITGWSINNSSNTILIMVNCWIKKKYYILCTIDENGTTQAIAQLLFQNV